MPVIPTQGVKYGKSVTKPWKGRQSKREKGRCAAGRRGSRGGICRRCRRPKGCCRRLEWLRGLHPEAPESTRPHPTTIATGRNGCYFLSPASDPAGASHWQKSTASWQGIWKTQRQKTERKRGCGAERQQIENQERQNPRPCGRPMWETEGKESGMTPRCFGLSS